jgi:hypothetical protein
VDMAGRICTARTNHVQAREAHGGLRPNPGSGASYPVARWNPTLALQRARLFTRPRWSHVGPRVSPSETVKVRRRRPTS